jgi:hypothetical protein
MSFTTNPNDSELGHGYDQHKKYLILSEEERSKGFIRPVRTSYRHVGKKIDIKGGTIESLSEDGKSRHGTRNNYVAFIRYPESESPVIGRAITQKELDNIGKYIGGCGCVTKMSRELAETYARNPKFYGSTYCVICKMHKPVNEFVWEGTDEIVSS